MTKPEVTELREGVRVPGTDFVLVNRDHLRIMVGEMINVRDVLERVRSAKDVWDRVQEEHLVNEWYADYRLVESIISAYEE